MGKTITSSVIDYWRDIGGYITFSDAQGKYCQASKQLGYNCSIDYTGMNVTRLLKKHGVKLGPPGSHADWKLKDEYVKPPVKHIDIFELTGRKQTKPKAQLILEFIRSTGGCRSTDIMKFVFNMNHPLRNFYERNSRGELLNRGYYATCLYGNGKLPGLLHKYCTQDPKSKKWFLTEEIEGPFYSHRTR